MKGELRSCGLKKTKRCEIPSEYRVSINRFGFCDMMLHTFVCVPFFFCFCAQHILCIRLANSLYFLNLRELGVFTPFFFFVWVGMNLVITLELRFKMNWQKILDCTHSGEYGCVLFLSLLFIAWKGLKINVMQLVWCWLIAQPWLESTWFRS